ncbi:MAG: energy transducer TonB [Candidatus Omnitrophica bacterium]|nr:energy transducer TonB [Candidatus Omnitrophota bacterium]
MKLLKDRNLNIALLISASWHIICMFSISPVLISPEIRKGYADVSFLGSILENVRAIPEKSIDLDRDSFVEKLEERKTIHSDDFELGLPEVFSKPAQAKSDKEESALSVKKDAGLVSELYSRGRENKRLSFKDVLVSGEAKNRLLLYKPDLPKLPFLLSGFYEAVIRFIVSKDGIVKYPECIVSSGSSEIDQLAIRYIRRWQFAPHDQDQEGVVRVKFAQ